MKYEIRTLSDFARGQRSDYYVESKNGKEAIFDKNGKMISPEWFDSISSFGLLYKQSKYYLARKNGKWAIFDVDGNQISDWFDDILTDGLVKGKSNLYIAKKDGKQAIFDKDGEMITKDWFDRIIEDGLVKGESDYFIACNEGKCAVYHKSGQKVSEEFPRDYINTLDVNFNDNLGILETGSRSIEFNPVYPFKEEFLDYTKLLNI